MKKIIHTHWEIPALELAEKLGIKGKLFNFAITVKNDNDPIIEFDSHEE